MYEETLGEPGPTSGKIAFADGRKWQLRNFRPSQFKVSQQPDAIDQLRHDRLGQLAYRIGTWQADVLFLGRKVFVADYSWSWDVRGQILVQHKKGGVDLVVDAWNPATRRLESTLFTKKGEIVTRAMNVGNNQATVTAAKDNPFGIEEIVEEIRSEQIGKVSGRKANGSAVWELDNHRFVNKLPLYLEDATRKAESFEFPSGVQVQHDIRFNTDGPVELKLDIARPADTSGKLPCAVVLHGGAWREGDKTNVHPTIALLAENGFAAAAVQYRLCPEHKFPCQVEDVKCAVRYLRAHADELEIDSDKIAAVGISAGGHLSLMIGMTSKDDQLEGDGGWDEFSSRVQAVANYFGPSGFVPETGGLSENETPEHPMLVDFVMAKNIEEMRRQLCRASPIEYASADDAPVLILHGRDDGLVPVEQAYLLSQSLRDVGVYHEMRIGSYNHGNMSPAEKQVTHELLVDFLKRTLRTRE